MADDIAALRRELAALRQDLDTRTARLTVLEDRAAIERLQYAYGYFMDNRMFGEMVDLFTDDAPWMEIGQRGRYVGKERIGRQFAPWHFAHPITGHPLPIPASAGQDGA